MNNVELIKKFYGCFSRRDAEGMADCYDRDIVFEDPAFGQLKGENAKNMWRMLVERSKGDLKITFSEVKANDATGEANWTAEYVFKQTGRKVINKIAARFEFCNGLIIKHTDHFDMWAWTQQALGWKGYLLGWSSFMKTQIQQQTNSLLKSYTKANKV